ncbi:MAG: 4Fe-4S dicluster domain-containing protein [Desulfovibrionaceae bacterium]
MSRIEVLEERCKGCLLCVEACPKAVIVQSGRFNQHGYKVAEAATDKKDECTGCAFCAMVCPDVAIRVYKTPKKAKEPSHAE